MSDVTYMRKGAEWVFKANTDAARIEFCSKLGMPVEYVQDVFLHAKDGPPRDRLTADLGAAGLTLSQHGVPDRNKPPPDPSAYLA